jgi:EpsI family protein
MASLERRALLAGAGLLLVAATGALANPRRRLATELPPLDLDANIPNVLGGWHRDQSIAPVLPSADVQEKINQLYNSVFSRTYIDAQGNRVMFLIAYGADQADRMTLAHLPEACYSSQGFDVWPTATGRVAVPGGMVEVLRLRTRKGPRVEPVTYWTTVGDGAYIEEFDRRVARARYSLLGVIPDGMLVRISSIDDNESAAFELQAAFIAALFTGIPGQTRERIFGSMS